MLGQGLRRCTAAIPHSVTRALGEAEGIWSSCSPAAFDALASGLGSRGLAEQSSRVSCTAVLGVGLRSFSAEAGAAPAEAPVGNEKVQKLAEEIAALSVLECSWLTQTLRKKLGIERSAMSMMPMMAAAPSAAPAAAAADAPKQEKAAQKTEFNLKLESFGAESKIKIIKEVRALTNLGLKEAKELVEKAPVVIKGGLPKADAEAMLKQLESAGAKVVLE